MLSVGERSLFKEITDDELARIEAAYQAAFADQTLDSKEARVE